MSLRTPQPSYCALLVAAYCAYQKITRVFLEMFRDIHKAKYRKRAHCTLVQYKQTSTKTIIRLGKCSTKLMEPDTVFA